MIKDLTTLQQFTDNKNIVLLGNARSILETKKDIDNFDIVCRINRGAPRGKEEFIGSRTDILFLATKMKGTQIETDFNPKFVVWTTVCQNLTTDWVKENAIQNVPEDWNELNNKIEKLPSTGFVTINFLIKHINFKKLTIHGFDFFRTGTWYHNLKNQQWHCFKEEEILIKELIKNKNVELIIEG